MGGKLSSTASETVFRRLSDFPHRSPERKSFSDCSNIFASQFCDFSLYAIIFPHSIIGGRHSGWLKGVNEPSELPRKLLNRRGVESISDSGASVRVCAETDRWRASASRDERYKNTYISHHHVVVKNFL